MLLQWDGGKLGYLHVNEGYKQAGQNTSSIYTKFQVSFPTQGLTYIGG